MFGIRSWHFLALSCHLASKIQSQNQNARKGHQIISNSHVRPLASALHIGILKWIRLRRPHIPGANARETVQEKLRKLDKAMTRQRSWNWERLESLKSKSLDLGWSWTACIRFKVWALGSLAPLPAWQHAWHQSVQIYKVPVHICSLCMVWQACPKLPLCLKSLPYISKAIEQTLRFRWKETAAQRSGNPEKR